MTAFKNKQKSQEGFTIVETLIAVLLCAGVLIIAGSVLHAVGKTSMFVSYSADEEANARSLEYILPIYMEQAINVDWTSSSINNIGSSRGELRIFKSSLSLTPQAPETIGVFLREAGRPNMAVPSSDLRGTAIYFRNPTATTEGELIISASRSGTGAVVLSSENPSHVFNSIVELEVSPGGFPSNSGDVVRVAKVRIVYRKFLSTEKNLWRWCPTADIAKSDCDVGARYKDIEHVFDIPFVNNTITTQFTNSSGNKRKETLFGDLYFFKLSQEIQ